MLGDPLAASPRDVEETLPPRLIRMAVAFTVTMSACNAIGTALCPWLLVEHPLVLVALAPEIRHMVLAVGTVDFWVLLVVGAARRVLSMLSSYGIAAVYGVVAIRWLEGRWPRVGRVARWLDRAMRRRGPLLLLIVPSYTMSVMAGFSRYPLRNFLAVTAVGQLWMVAVYLLVGESILGWTAPLLGWLRGHVWECTAATVTVVGIQQGVSQWRKRRRAG